MLQTMRDNAQGMIAKVIVGFIIIVFALWGVESIVSLGTGPEATATVGDIEITEADISRVVEQQKNNLRRQFGDQYDENLFNEKFLRDSAIEQLIEQNLALVQADEMGLYASPREIDESIVTIPAFQQDGKFSRDQFQTVLRMNGMSPMGFRQVLGDEIKTRQAQAAFVLSSMETPVSVKLSEALNNELRTFSYSEILAKDLESGIEVSEEDIQAAYEASKDRYKTPEQVSLNYVELKRSDLAADETVSEEELQQAYDDYKAQEASKEQRSASHILIEVNDDRSDEEAKALADEVYQKIENGGDFAELAKEYSDDIASANNGGSLGLTPKGSFVPEFDDALYSLPKGEVSKPVQTEFGYHIIRTDDIVAPQIKALADIKDELSENIKLAKAEAVYAERLQELSNLAFSGETIDAVAESIGLQPQSTELFSRQQGVGVAENEAVRQAAFSDEVMLDKQMSDVIETEEGALVVSVKDHVDASVLPLDVVRAQVEQSLLRERAVAKAQEVAEAVAAGNQEAEWTQVSATYTQSTEAPRAAQQKVFSLLEGKTAAVQTPGGYTVVKLDSVDGRDWKEMAVSDEATETGRADNSRAAMASYQSWARSAIKVERSGS
ncbi:MAG: hypothetical protein CMI08_01145 [Oceanospirillaceae bacterium]|uniref:SurA N-terminal domain-containing protein n=1 Tax=unclassified Thalassolituus TaxID=2624967 RepID=UPI000C654C93|nr:MULTISPECIES: SurA N-terminal domain-containing protein [unclassified Thalassolituus]MAS24692.1 hypothetical protein [Oceanospirillaceae bacterium]MAX97801.1 hypothetical protein [Oceanospirillaceae bacterium]MBL34847.1 hypothetical protein [Oceanospirillaceae bacterium]MBS53467.1 hypothetical protein [Oceanospirillaceae bacterium]